MRHASRVGLLVSVVCITSFIAVGCGESALAPRALSASRPGTTTSIARIDEFVAIEKITIEDGGDRCAALSIGRVVEFSRCFDIMRRPLLVGVDSAGRFILIAVGSGDVLTFLGTNVRAVATSEHWVAAQMSTATTPGDVVFTVTSDEGTPDEDTQLCVLSDQLVTYCNE